MKMDQVFSKNDIQLAVYEALDEVNFALSKDDQIAKDPKSKIFGNESRLDSLNVINLLVTTEEKISKRMGKKLSLVAGSDIFDLNNLEKISSVEYFVNYLYDALFQEK
jgi:acyl carrier protein